MTSGRVAYSMGLRGSRCRRTGRPRPGVGFLWTGVAMGGHWRGPIGHRTGIHRGAHAFETLLRHNRAHSGYIPILGSPWLTALAQRSAFAAAFRSGSGCADQNPSGHTKFRAELEELPLDEWPTRFRRLISDHVSLCLRRTVDPDRPLSQYGLDSLGNLELRTRIETETGVRLHAAKLYPGAPPARLSQPGGPRYRHVATCGGCLGHPRPVRHSGDDVRHQFTSAPGTTRTAAGSNSPTTRTSSGTRSPIPLILS
ncbi:acyl carrier protein [Mycobacterium intermedium]|nr:acyl carrier protein [Mycobacterium intermedium]